MCTRELGGEAVEFGTSGYTMDGVFVLYDRTSDSVWYPTSGEALEEARDRLLSGTLGEIAACFGDLQSAVRPLIESPAIGVAHQPAVGAVLDRLRQHVNRWTDQSLGRLASK